MIKNIKGDRTNINVTTDDIKTDMIDILEAALNNQPGVEKVEMNISPNNEEIAFKYTNSNEGTQLAFDFSTGEIGDETTASLSAVYMPDEDAPETPRWVWNDPVIFDDDTKKLFMRLSPDQRPRFVIDVVDRFYAARPEYNNFARAQIYSQPLDLLELFKSLTIEDFKSCKIPNAESRFDMLQDNIKTVEATIEKTPIDPKKLSTIWPVLSMREMFIESELAAFYYLKNPKKSARELAAEKGALMTTGGRLADISNKDYSGWLDEIPNDSAYISYVGPHYWDNIEVDEGGNLYEGDEARVQRAVREQDAKILRAFDEGSFGNERPKEHERINKEVLRALLNATIKVDGAYRTIYLPAFAAELNENYKVDVDEYEQNGELNDKGKISKAAADLRAKEAEEARKNGQKVYTKEKPSIMQQFYSLDYWVGVLDGSFPKRTAIITGLNPEAKTIEVVLPYIDEIKRRVEEVQQLEMEKKRRAYMLPVYNKLVYSSIDAERNKLAVDLVYTIIDKLLQRGSKPASEFKENQTDDDQEEKKGSKKVVYRIKYSSLVKDTPLLAMAYKNADNVDKKYKVLQRTFKKAFELLHSKTDLYEYFLNLKIPETPPTIRTIDNTLIITHSGRNPKYKKI